MKKSRVLLLICVSAACLTAAWLVVSRDGSPVISNAQASPGSVEQISTGRYSGSAIETMNAGTYTYVRVDLGAEKVWVAGPATTIKLGENVSIDKNMPMYNFHSKTLNRDFDVVYFVGSFGKGAEVFEKIAHGAETDQPKVPANIKKADHGKNIQEIYQQKNNLEGKLVRVRGMVTKYTANVLGKDWIHLRDNSSASDLTVTTQDAAKIGDLVVAEGRLHLKKDFGYGYVYEVLLEDVKLSVE